MRSGVLIKVYRRFTQVFCFNLDLKFIPIPGYQGSNRSIYSENIFGMTYQQSKQKADELLRKINEDKSHQYMKSSRFFK
jgi:hypothetical protein